MNRKIRVLFVSPYKMKSSFMVRDIELLRQHFNLKIVDFTVQKSRLKKVFLFCELTSRIIWADVTYSWFADVHAYWAVRITNILRKKSVVVIGGYEVAKIPELRYGLLLNPKSESCVKFILSNATQMLTVDDGLKKDAIMNTGLNDLNIQTVPTGYDFTRFFPSGEKEKMILTVCSFDTWERAQLKGVNTFVKCANFFPSYTFLIIGAQDKAVKQISKIAPENVKVIGLIPNEELVHYYQKAKVYCQLSMREGLPNSLCEAMLCECVPVGTDIPGIRSAIGDTGYYVPYGNIDSTVDALQKALRSEKGNLARERIVNNFPLEKREKRLKQIINSLIPSIN